MPMLKVRLKWLEWAFKVAERGEAFGATLSDGAAPDRCGYARANSYYPVPLSCLFVEAGVENDVRRRRRLH